MSSALENYLAGVPLNEELAKLRAGTLPDFGPLPVPGTTIGENESTGGPDGPISRADRVALKEFRQGPAYAVLQRLLKKATLIHTESAKLLSEKDPYSSDQQQAWAYLKIWKRVANDLNLMIETEIRILEEGEPDETEPTVKGPQARRTARKSSGPRARKN